MDESDRILLVRFWDGDQSWWCTPGGGVELGETDESAALRELREELGEADVQLGPCIWTRRHVGVFRGNPFDQSERIYLGRVWRSSRCRRLMPFWSMIPVTSAGGQSTSS